MAKTLEKLPLLENPYILEEYYNNSRLNRRKLKTKPRSKCTFLAVFLIILTTTALILSAISLTRCVRNRGKGITSKNGQNNAKTMGHPYLRFAKTELKIAKAQSGWKKPNLFIFLADDFGYGDLAVYGHPTQPWGDLDQLAISGMRFTQFYSDSLCTPARAQLLTGRLAVRSGLSATGARVFGPSSSGGLPQEEITLAELLKNAGYTTGMNGKWHLGDYGDTVAEMSWSAGEVVRHLENLGLADNTLFIFLSDNGAASYYSCETGGINFPFKGTKGTSWEGGHRVPGFAYWPNKIKPRTISDAVLQVADIYVTLGILANATLPTDRVLDGLDISSILFGNGIPSKKYVNRPIFYYCDDFVRAVRLGQFKIHYGTVGNNSVFEESLVHCVNGIPQADNRLFFKLVVDCNSTMWHNPPLVFNIEKDPSEQFPLQTEDVDVVIKAAESVVEAQKKTLFPVENQMLIENPWLAPCCIEKDSKKCGCNYK